MNSSRSLFSPLPEPVYAAAMPAPALARTPAILLVLAMGLVSCLGGCAGLGLRRPSGPLITSSADGKKQLAPEFATVVYESSSIAAAEIYLTDLPPDRLLNPRDNLTGLSGSIIQIRLMIVPKAGNTPIGDTACNVTIRHIVLGTRENEAAVPPEVGVYGGGGFLYPGNTPGASSMSGSIAGGTVRPIAWTSGFVDLLGPSELSGGFTARHDEPTSRGIKARIQNLLSRADQRPADQSTTIASPKE